MTTKSAPVASTRSSCRQARDEDAAAIDALALSCGLHVRAASELASPWALLLVVPGDSALQGFASFRRVADEAELLDIAVAPSARRTGVARQLLQRGKEALRDLGSRALFLEVKRSNEGARQLYEQQGFEECGQRPRYYPSGEDAILYRWTL